MTLFIINVNVLFLSNSQHWSFLYLMYPVVYHQCHCSLFKQFTTILLIANRCGLLFIINVNVPFLSNCKDTFFHTTYHL